MAALTPIQLAQLLGYTPGIDASPAQISSAAESEPVLETFEYLHKIPQEPRYVFVDELAALCLPSLFRTYLSLPLTSSQNIGPAFIYASAIIVHSAFFSRFVRNHPEEACSFFSKLVRSIADCSDSSRKGLGNVSDIVLYHSTTLFTTIVIKLLQYLPSNIPLPSLEGETRSNFIHVVDSLERRGVGDQDGIVLLRSFIQGGMKVRNKQELELAPCFTGWWMCEWTADETTLRSPVMCAEREGGKEMDACSRCLTVRYCSKEHQKLDWKRHKLHCFKPSW